MLALYLLQVIAAVTNPANAQPTKQPEIQPLQSAHGTLKFSYEPNITRVTIDHPPINLFDTNLTADLQDFMLSIQPDSSGSNVPPKVVIFDSADPEIFVSHVDFNGLLNPDLGSTIANRVYNIIGLLRNTSTVAFISEINGLATGVGNEFLMQTDMRFAGPNTRSSQVENAAGVFPGAGGQQAIPRLIGRGRGLQYVLASQAIDGPTGANYGWFNEYHNDTTSLRTAVDTLARRIALFPASSIEATKSSLVELYPGPEVYQRDRDNFVRLASTPQEQAIIRRALELGKNQSRSAFELGLPDTFLQLWQ